MNTDVMSREDVLGTLKRLKEELQARYGVTRIGVFGSLARNEANGESDVDVVVEMKPDLFARAGLRAELETLFGRSVDVVRYWRGMNPNLKRRIDREALYV